MVGPLTAKLRRPAAVRTHGISQIRLNAERKFSRPDVAVHDRYAKVTEVGWMNTVNTLPDQVFQVFHTVNFFKKSTVTDNGYTLAINGIN